MKYSHLTYYLLAILCMMATSCVSDGVMGDCPIDNNDQAVLIEGGKVNFALTFPTSSTRGINGSSEGLASERTINDVQVYTFVGGKFVEKVYSDKRHQRRCNPLCRRKTDRDIYDRNRYGFCGNGEYGK